MAATSGVRRQCRIAAAAGIALAVLAVGEAPSFAQSAAESCLAANPTPPLGAHLARSAARLKADRALRIVAVGSSSTTGLWVLSTATYPEVMRRQLSALRPGAKIEVINSGRIGDTVPASLARFANDVLAHRPDLVIWQLGTNDAAWGGGAEGLKSQIIAGIRVLKTADSDIILMDLQYSPVLLASSQTPRLQSIIAEAAKEERVGLFSRFALMRRAIAAGVPSGALVAWDGLHNSADGYDCIGRALARAINAAAR